MAKLRIQGDSTGYVDLEAPTNASSSTLNLDQVPQLNQDTTFTQAVYHKTSAYFGSDDVRVSSDGSGEFGIGYGQTATTKRFSVYNGTSNRFSVSPEGYVTKPNHPVAYIKEMTGSAGNSLTGGNAYVVRGGMGYNSTTGALTVPVSGVYSISVSAFTNANNGRLLLQVTVNGSTNLNGSGISECMATSGDGNYDTASQTIYLYLSANDYIGVFVNAWTTSIYPGGNGNTLAVTLVG